MPGNLRRTGSRLKVIVKSGTAEVIDFKPRVGYLTGNEPQAWISQQSGQSSGAFGAYGCNGRGNTKIKVPAQWRKSSSLTCL